MKTQISRISHTPSKRYSAIYQQQGRMITDADWNELQDIVKHRIDEVVRDLVGDGVPAHRGLEIELHDGQVYIKAGRVYAGGVGVGTDGAHLSSWKYTYNKQADFPQAQGSPMQGDFVYADIWEREVTHLEDAGLKDPGLLGADTCTRTQTLVQIKLWRSEDPTTSSLNPTMGNGRLTLKLRPGITAPLIVDPGGATGNYLFRVEVHQVLGTPIDPQEITVKWSRENGAEAFPIGGAPGDFVSSEYVYEFYTANSDLVLGVHCPQLQPPARLQLVDEYQVPAVASGPDKPTHVRRWDGYCKLVRNGPVWTLEAGRDRGQVLSTSGSAGHGHVSIEDGVLYIGLQALDLQLALRDANDKAFAFVAGDYWLAQVREDDGPLKELLKAGTPIGVQHRYLKLGKVVLSNGKMAFEEVPELKFPALVDLKALATSSADASMITTDAVSGTPYELKLDNVAEQLEELLGHLNGLHAKKVSKAGDQMTGSLTVGDRIRLKQGISGTAGLWLFQNGPNADRAFIGMQSDNTVGLWGHGDTPANRAWRFMMNVNTGNVGILTDPAGAGGAALSVNGNVAIKGNLGLSVDKPEFRLDVSDRIRLRQGTSSSAGLWLFQNGPNADRAFIGMQNDNTVGLWGHGDTPANRAWRFMMNVNTGNVGILTDPAGAGGAALSVNGNVALKSALDVATTAHIGGNVGIGTDPAGTGGPVLSVGGNVKVQGRVSDDRVRHFKQTSEPLNGADLTGWSLVQGIDCYDVSSPGAYFLVGLQLTAVRQYPTTSGVQFRFVIDNQRQEHVRKNFSQETGQDATNEAHFSMGIVLYLGSGNHDLYVEWLASESVEAHYRKLMILEL